MSVLRERISNLWSYKILFLGLPIFLLLIAMTGFMVTKEWIWLVMPLAFLALVWGIRDFRLVYLLIWASIPFAIEIDLPGGLSTDLPSEQLMWLSFLLLPAYLVLNRGRTNFRFIFQPIFILLFLHFSWIVITSITSQEPLISFKYTLAKTWYLVCFIVIPILLLKDKADYQRWGLFLFIPLVASIVIILIRHSFYGFTFSTINNAIIPIYRNHVDYACCIALALPFAWWQRRAAEDRRLRWFYTLAMILIVTGIYFSFTRAAWVCVPLSIGSYFLIRWKLLRIVIPVALAGVILFTAWLSYDNRYISYSPDYRKAITHKNFEDLVSATYKMEDISTVERFYRWVAGYYMVKEKPWLGSGPASFYSLYQNYVDRHFTTYVSNNPEHSGIHNYYLMTAVEQGVIGLMIFLALIMMVMISGEQLYHRMKPGAEQKLVMAALISFICNLFILTLNDTVETDKLGTFFFFCIAIIMVFLLREKEMAVA